MLGMIQGELLMQEINATARLTLHDPLNSVQQGPIYAPRNQHPHQYLAPVGRHGRLENCVPMRLHAFEREWEFMFTVVKKCESYMCRIRTEGSLRSVWQNLLDLACRATTYHGTEQSSVWLLVGSERAVG